MIPLAVGENVIAVEVTAEDGQTTKTYAVKVTRAEASLPVTVDLSPSGPVTEGTEIAVTMTFGGLDLRLRYAQPRTTHLPGRREGLGQWGSRHL